MSSFARAFRDFIHYSIYSKFTSIVFGAYNKAIQSYFQYRSSIAEVPDFGVPLMSYTFQIEVPDERVDSMWRSSTFMPGLANPIYKPFYNDDELDARLIFRRIKGTINFNVYCSSEPEMIDIQLAFLDGFHGLNRFRQSRIKSVAVIPEVFLFTDVYGQKVSKAITSEKITRQFFKEVNSTKFFIHINTSSLVNLQSISPSVTYYGGAALPEYGLTGACLYEFEVPQYVLCNSVRTFRELELNVDVDHVFEDEKTAALLHSITGDQIFDQLLPLSSDIVSFENGQIIDRKVLKIDKTFDNEISFDELFPPPRSFDYGQKDIVVITTFAGGAFISTDPEIGKIYTYQGGKFKYARRYFNEGDLVHFFIFKQRD
jgi:hypothetical protein